MSRFVPIAATAASLFASAAFAAPDSVTVVAGSYTQGTVKPGLATAAYQNTATNLHDFARDTGSYAGTVYPVALSNNNYSGGTLLAFGNGGGVTLKFDSAVRPLAGQKEIGVYTAQFLLDDGTLFNGNMEASVLVSADGTNWRTLAGQSVAANYAATSNRLNAPASGYVYGSGANSFTLGEGTDAATVAGLTPADYLTPMVNDAVFNDPTLGTAAARAALIGDSTPAGYSATYGTTGGGNWFDISASGLDSVNYLRLNGVNTDTNGGIRLDSVFAANAAVPEPTTLAGLGLCAVGLLRRRR